MGTRRTSIALSVALLAAAAACGAEASVVSRGTPGSETTPPSGDPLGAIALVLTEKGLAGVPVGSSEPRWIVPRAVAAPDGTAVFASDLTDDAKGVTQLRRLDPRTGHEIGRWSIPGKLLLNAVAPRAALVALTQALPGPSTEVVAFDPGRGEVARQRTFDGQFEPEAFAPDGRRVFAAKIMGDHYHVFQLDLVSGAQAPTLGPEKQGPPEDMYGNVVQAALSPDQTRLATLYRDSIKPGHTAFVHLLDLPSGLTVCIDLHEPFGTAGPGTDAVRWTGTGIEVGHRGDDGTSGTTATFDPRSIQWAATIAVDSEPGALQHYHADAGPSDDPPAVPEGVTATPGFKRFVVLAT